MFQIRSNRFQVGSNRFQVGSNRFQIGLNRQQIGSKKVPIGPNRYQLMQQSMLFQLWNYMNKYLTKFMFVCLNLSY